MKQLRTHSLHEGRIVSNIIFYGERFATKERRTIPYPTPRMFELEEMTIYNSTIIISELKNCSLYNCLIVGSSVDDSELNHCTVLQEVQFSEIQEPSVLRNCKVRDWCVLCLILILQFIFLTLQDAKLTYYQCHQPIEDLSRL
jgi:hypothetical protein